MAPSWKLILTVESRSLQETQALADCLTTDEETTFTEDGMKFSFELDNLVAKDLRAMWNTRIRGLIAVDNVLKVINEHSSTPSV
jgi:hypothetical protein